MGKVITVWGSPGSGKSMFSCILAKALTRDKRKAIIINAEISVPMLPVWLPEQIIQTNASVGQVLSSVEIDTSLVAGHVTVLKSYPFIGVMGYAAGENPLSYPEVKYAMVVVDIGVVIPKPSDQPNPDVQMCRFRIEVKFSRITGSLGISAEAFHGLQRLKGRQLE